MIRVAFSLIILHAASSLIGGQAVETGWKGVRPLLSSQTDVEKAFGKPERIDDNGYYNYRMNDSYVRVNYSTEPCRSNQYERGKFNVPANTVLNLWISLKKTILLADLDFDRKKYYRDTSGDVINSVDYFNKEAGIGIGTSIHDEKRNEYVGTIEYSPSETLKAKFICK